MFVTRTALIGGEEEHCYQLARYLVTQGCSVLWVVLLGSVNSLYKQLPSVRFLTLNDSVSQSFSSFYSLKRIVKLVWRFKPGIVHLHGIRPMLLFSLIPFPSKVRRISTVHASYLLMAMNDDTGKTIAWKCILSKLFHIYCCVRSHCILTVSQALADEMQQLISPFRFNHLNVVFNGVECTDSSGVEPFPDKYAETFLYNELQVVFVGRLDVKKGVELLIRAVASVAPLVQIRCHIFGDGYQRPRFESLAQSESVSDRVHFWGYNAEIKNWLKAFDVLVLPSYSEGMGIAVLEAMAAGLPVVATRTGGIPEAVVDEKTGYLIATGDLKALTNRLEDLYQDKNIRLQFGLAGKERAFLMFNQDIQLPKIIDYYHLNTKLSRSHNWT
jgi:glycosyltransferase involved in cell wall biosynthesis